MNQKAMNSIPERYNVLKKNGVLKNYFDEFLK